MNNTALKIIAGLLLIGSLVVAYIGVKLSDSRPAPPPAVVIQPPVAVPTEPVIVTTRELQPGQVITPQDIAVKNIQQAPSDALRDMTEVLGRVSANRIDTGAVLKHNMLAADTMARLLKVGERAMAVQVDEVVSIGGYVRPGDRVDVMLFIPANRETNEQSSAQVVLQNVRLLSIGDVNQMTTELAKRSEEKSAASTLASSSDNRDRGQPARSAVLAIPATDAPRLMLAASSGQLRLALRPPQAEPQTTTSDNAGYAKLIPNSSPTEGRRTTTLAEIAPGARKPAQPTERVIIQEGSKERLLDKTESPASQLP
jgi:pilus assembly protein CpaB